MKMNILRRNMAHFALAFVIFGTFLSGGRIKGISTIAALPTPANPEDAQENRQIYLPIMLRQLPLIPTIFGVETSQFNTSNTTLIKNVGAYWVRYQTLSWADIEPVRTNPPTYHWETVDEAGLAVAAAHKIKVIAIVKYTPLWAQKLPGKYCGPVASGSLDEFAEFMQAAIARYRAWPYYVKYWEIGNEPDVDPALLADPWSPYGCWGDNSDRNYGGGYYATMLKTVYPAIKAIDPEAQVIVGGLLLDCDPANPPPGKSCKPARFIDGILSNQGGAYFDYLGFHGYGYYTSGLIDDAGGWAARGGVILGKINYLRERMALYGVNKPLFLTETSLICPVDNVSLCASDGAFLEKQADYVSWAFLRAWAEGVKGATWYTVEESGWRSSGLSSPSGPKPAYYAYQFAAGKLSEMTLSASITQYPGLKGYEFRASGKRVWVLWAADQVDHAIPLPPGTLQVWNKYGNVIQPSNGQIIVNSPIYIDLMP